MKTVQRTILVMIVLTFAALPVLAETVKGEIYNVGSAALTLTSKQRFTVNSNTGVTINGAKAAYTQLKPGMAVVVDYVKCNSRIGICATLVQATSSTTSSTTSPAKGEIYHVGTYALRLTSGQAFTVTANTVVTLNGSKIVYGKLQPGMAAVVDFVKCNSKIGVCATGIQASTK